MEKERTKLEKKAQKIEKERQKLKRMKQKFGDSGESQNVVEMSGSTFVIKADFAEKIREWEQMKGKKSVLKQRQSVAVPSTSIWQTEMRDEKSNRMLNIGVDQSHHHRSHSAKEARVSS